MKLSRIIHTRCSFPIVDGVEWCVEMHDSMGMVTPRSVIKRVYVKLNSGGNGAPVIYLVEKLIREGKY